MLEHGSDGDMQSYLHKPAYFANDTTGELAWPPAALGGLWRITMIPCLHEVSLVTGCLHDLFNTPALATEGYDPSTVFLLHRWKK